MLDLDAIKKRCEKADDTQEFFYFAMDTIPELVAEVERLRELVKIPLDL